jgi:anti-sigma regulatory factor (Ser/Thr protein kinase)
MKIYIPNSAFLGNIENFIRPFDPADESRIEIVFNKNWMSVHPIVLSMTAALATSMKMMGKKVECEVPIATSKHYLKVMGLFKFLDVEHKISIREHEPAGRFIPLTQISNSRELGVFITEMIPLLHTTPSQTEPIKYVISELVRNVFEHSQSSVGAMVCAQFFKKSNKIAIGVADVGIGIKQSIKVSHSVNDDLNAIKLALRPGITGTTRKIGGTASNAGAGLFFIKSIAKVNRDFFVIYSGQGMYKLRRTSNKQRIVLNADPDRDQSSSEGNFPLWKGTAVGVDISISKSQRFESLLKMIRDVYRLDVSQERRHAFKRPRFI